MTVTVVGSINADESIRVRHLPAPGETVTASRTVAALGGKGANQAVAAARAGADVRMVGALGPEASWLLSTLSAEGIDIDRVARLTETATGRAIVLVDDGAENSIVVIPGANHAIPEEVVIDATSRMGAGDVLLIQQEVPTATSQTAAHRAHVRGAKVIWNAAPAPSNRSELIEGLDLLLVNRLELAAIGGLLGASERDQLDIERLFGRVVAELNADIVCTLGSDGAAYSVGGVYGRATTRRVHAIDTTAAGDTVAGYLAATTDLPFAESLRLALLAGSLAVTRAGAATSIPSRAEVEHAAAMADDERGLS